MSLQQLPVSLRGKQRYIVFCIVGLDEPGFGGAVKAVWDGMLGFMGEKGVAAADPWMMKNLYDEEGNRGVIRVNKEYVAETRMSLALIQEVGGDKVCFAVEGVTGTLDAAEEKYL